MDTHQPRLHTYVLLWGTRVREASCTAALLSQVHVSMIQFVEFSIENDISFTIVLEHCTDPREEDARTQSRRTWRFVADRQKRHLSIAIARRLLCEAHCVVVPHLNKSCLSIFRSAQAPMISHTARGHASKQQRHFCPRLYENLSRTIA